MSTGLNCEIIEPFPGTWYYILEDGFAPKNVWDWREYATATGPFPNERAAIDYLADNEANPGGTVTIPNDTFKMTASYLNLLAVGTARKPKQSITDWF